MRRFLIALAAAACIIAPFHAFADGAFVTCKGYRGIGIYAEGGIIKPGWNPQSSDQITQIWARKDQTWDIVVINNGNTYVFSKNQCQTTSKMFDPKNGLDQLFISLCPDRIHTYLLYQREGVYRLLETRTDIDRLNAGTFEAQSDCELGSGGK